MASHLSLFNLQSFKDTRKNSIYFNIDIELPNQ